MDNYEKIILVEESTHLKYKIYKALNKGSKSKEDKYVLLKMIKKNKYEPKLYDNFIKKEVENLKICLINNEKDNKINENTQRLYDYFETDEEYVFVLEYCEYSLKEFINLKNSEVIHKNEIYDLYEFCKNLNVDKYTSKYELNKEELNNVFNYEVKDYFLKREKGLELKDIKLLFFDLNKGFHKMQKENIINGNLTLDNIYIKFASLRLYSPDSVKIKYETYFDYYIPKIANYGIIRKINDLIYPNKIPVNINYLAPEVVLNKDYSTKSDLWSIGIMLYRLYYGKFPAEFNNSVNSFYKEIENKKDKIKTEDENFDDLLNGLLEYDVNKRINFHDYFFHKFFKYEDENLKRFNVSYNANIGITLCGIDLDGYNIGNKGFKILSKVNFLRLKVLSLDYNNISNLEFLKNLNQLKGLWLNNNKIMDIKPLSYLPDLEIIYLNNNIIQDISVFISLHNITEVFLEFNIITDIQYLEAMKMHQFKVLDLYGNPIDLKTDFNKKIYNYIVEH